MDLNERMAKAFYDSLPSRLYVALERADETEPPGGGYDRVPIERSELSLSGGTIANAVRITFPVASSPWGQIRRVCIYAEAKGGSDLMSLDMLKARDIAAQDEPYLPPGQLRFEVVPIAAPRASA